jgi:hypothetical protein
MPAGGPQLRWFNLPPVPNPLQANFANQLRLLGYSIQPYPPLTTNHQSPITNHQLPITLYWQAITSPEPLTRFVQLIGPDGQLYGQQDSAPDGGLYPTHHWQPGEVVVETVNIPVKPDRPAGPYTLHVGLYRPTTGERLGLPAGGDHVEIRLSR